MTSSKSRAPRPAYSAMYVHSNGLVQKWTSIVVFSIIERIKYMETTIKASMVKYQPNNTHDSHLLINSFIHSSLSLSLSLSRYHTQKITHVLHRSQSAKLDFLYCSRRLKIVLLSFASLPFPRWFTSSTDLTQPCLTSGIVPIDWNHIPFFCFHSILSLFFLLLSAYQQTFFQKCIAVFLAYLRSIVSCLGMNFVFSAAPINLPSASYTYDRLFVMTKRWVDNGSALFIQEGDACAV